MRHRTVTIVAALTALAAAGVALAQLRTGIVPMLDTVTYWSGAGAVTEGRPFTTTLAPSFSNFDTVEFIERGGRLPFVDFPVGYPLLAGIIGSVVGVGHAMGALAVIATATTAGLIVIGPRPIGHVSTAVVRVVAALGVAVVPTYRVVTQATLSEPIFCALVVAFVVVLVRHRDGLLPWWPVVVLGSLLGLFRFIGAPVSILAGVEHYRRHRSVPRALGWVSLMMAPAALNIVWAAASGGGHNAGWRGLDGDDVEILVRSVGGWVDTVHGDLRLTYFAGAGASWWAWLLALVWLSSLIAAVGSIALGLRRRGTRRRLPVSLETPLAAAAILTAGLVLGMLGFDALVLPDNRLMLPSGVLTLCGLLWWGTERVDAFERRRWGFSAALSLVVVWVVLASRPWTAGEIFNDDRTEANYVRAARASGAALVIMNDADGVHIRTGLPAAYPPMPTRLLTGEAVDVDAAYRSLPCPLAENNGVLVTNDEAFLAAAGQQAIDEMVVEGRLIPEPFEGGVIYRPSSTACS